jgi:hypothetical protein
VAAVAAPTNGLAEASVPYSGSKPREESPSVIVAPDPPGSTPRIVEHDEPPPSSTAEAATAAERNAPTKPPARKPPVPRSTAKPPTVPTRVVRADDEDDAHAPREPREDGRIPGVPRKVSLQAKRTVAAVVAGAALLVVAGGLRAMQNHQQRLAEEARTRPVETGASVTSAPASPGPTPPAIPSATTPEPVAAPPSAEPPPAASSSPAPAIDPAPSTGGTMEVHVAEPAASPVSASPPQASPRPVAELPLEGHDTAGGSLVSQANHALAKGATTRAISLARQAVAANPDDADAWLTLGAACQANGDAAGARDAYRNCVGRAHTANVSECRLLARP